jgi:Zn-finger nucleic acid-binding protein
MIARLLCWLFGHAAPDCRVTVMHDHKAGVTVTQCPRCRVRIELPLNCGAKLWEEIAQKNKLM